MWLRAPAWDQQPPDMFMHQPPIVSTAASVLRHGGSAALRSFLLDKSREPASPVFVVDENNHELLNRPVTAEIIEHAKQLATQPNNSGMIERVVADDGHNYLLFIELPDFTHFDGYPVPPNERDLLPPLMPLLAGGLVSLFLQLCWPGIFPSRSANFVLPLNPLQMEI